MSSHLTTVYEFDRFRIDRLNRRLARDGLLVGTPGVTFPLLVMLIENRDHIVSIQKLVNEFFPKSSSGEEQLSSEILKLKRLLDDNSKQLPIIRTVAGQGYQFEAEVSEFLGDSFIDEKFGSGDSGSSAGVDAGSARGAEQVRRGVVGVVVTVLAAGLGFGIWHFLRTGDIATSTSHGTEPSVATDVANDAASSAPAPVVEASDGHTHVAVLPFQSLSGSAGDDEFNRGLTKALVQALAKAKVEVVPQDAVKRYLDSGVTGPVTAGRELGAQLLVHGMAQRLAGRVVIKVQLVNTTDGSQIWSDGLDGDQNNVSDLAEKMAVKISKAVK